MESTSGGIFAQIATDFLTINPNSIVIGANLENGINVQHISITEIKDIKKIQGSKYLQSNTNRIYSEAINYLKNNRKVLFSGTPCQIAAIQSVVKGKAYASNLITCEVICHGIPSFIHFKMSLKLNGATKIISFRDKKEKGWGNGWNPIYDSSKPAYKGYFYDCFFNDLFLKPSCYKCKFATLPRIADISIADGWGVRNTDLSEAVIKDGISLVLINSAKGKEIIKNNKIELIPAKWEHFLPNNPCIITNLSYLKPLSLSNFISAINRLPLGLAKYIFALKSPNKGWGLVAKPYIIIMLWLKKRQEKVRTQIINNKIIETKNHETN